MSLVRNGLVALVVLQIGSGCALFRPDPTPPAFERISLQGQVEKTDDGKLEGDTHSDSALKGVTIGFVSGGITGGGLGLAYGAVACVPTAFFYPICLIVAVFVGVVVGAPTGMVLGGATGLPWKTTGEVDTLLANISRSRDFQREFQEAVMAAVPPKNQVPPG